MLKICANERENFENLLDFKNMIIYMIKEIHKYQYYLTVSIFYLMF